MLNDIEIKLLRARGFGDPQFTQLSPRDVVARASKRTGERAEALGRTPEDAARKLVAMVARP